jgi:hypothetical protein
MSVASALTAHFVLGGSVSPLVMAALGIAGATAVTLGAIAITEAAKTTRTWIREHQATKRMALDHAVECMIAKSYADESKRFTRALTRRFRPLPQVQDYQPGQRPDLTKAMDEARKAPIGGRALGGNGNGQGDGSADSHNNVKGNDPDHEEGSTRGDASLVAVPPQGRTGT